MLVILLLIILIALGAYFYYTPPFPVTAEQQRAKRHCDAFKEPRSQEKLGGFIIGGSVDCRTLQIKSIGPNPFK